MRGLVWIFVALVALMLAACGGSADQTAEQDLAMLTIITSPEPETQLMALVLTKSAQAHGEKPEILLCGPGGDLALKSPSPSATAPLQPKGMSPQGLLTSLMQGGVSVKVCAIYLPNRPFGADALLDGVGVATPDEMGSLIASPAVRVLSF